MALPKGPYTGCDLSDVTSLCMPWREMNHLLRPEFSHAAAALSLELASTAYDMRTAPWRENGWFDVSYLVDNALFTGPAVNGQTADGAFSPALAERYQRAAEALLKKKNPISLVRGTLRQRESSDTCKCVVMMHRAGPGRYVAAIGFMGTGRRIYDWFSNFRTDREEGAHKGFLQLTREFEASCPLIQFPETARELGREALTLQDVLLACRRPGSPFRVWMAGHSQGGAVMQLAALREIRRGMLRQTLVGYGFASPSALYESPGGDLGGVPLFHIINGDDPTPRVGAYLHVGRCMLFRPDGDARKKFYGDAWQDPAFRDALALLRFIQGSREGLISTVALLRALEALSDREAAEVMGKMLGGLLPDRMLAVLGSRTDQFLRFAARRAEDAYEKATAGEALPAGRLRQLQARITALIQRHGAPAFGRGLLLALAAPHRLRGVDKNTGGKAPYQAIVSDYFPRLGGYPTSGSVPRVCAGRPLRGPKAPPVCRYRRFARLRNQRAVR